MREREIKVEVDTGFAIPDLSGVLADATPADPAVRENRDTYYDTADLRLARWGVTLRYRTGDGWTVKLPALQPSLLLDREEVVLPGAASRIPADVAALVASFARSADLAVVARLSTRRLAVALLGADGAQVAELADDTVTAQVGGTRQTFREIELELAATTDDEIAEAVYEALIDAGARPAPPIPKLVRALGATAAAPPDVEVPLLTERPSAAEVIRLAIATSVTRLVVSLPIARLGVDPEGVHQARVATRRLRSDLRTFESLLDSEWVDGLRSELAWLATELGRVRDADVLGERLRATISRRVEIDPVAAQDLLDTLVARRERDRTVLLGHLGEDRARTLFDHLVDAAQSPRTTNAATRSAQKIMPRLVRKRWSQLQKVVDVLGDDPSPGELHAVRLLAKRVRYASDAVAPVIGQPAVRFARGAARLQDILGEGNDAAVAAAWLAEVAAELRGPGAFAAGQLAQVLASEASSDAKGWREVYGRMLARSDWLE